MAETAERGDRRGPSVLYQNDKQLERYDDAPTYLLLESWLAADSSSQT